MKLNWSFPICFLVLIALPSFSFAGVEDDMASAKKSMDEQDLDAAANKFKILAEQNYLPAQVALGELFRYAEDNDTALGWFMMAAYQGEAAGEFGLGKMYYEGTAVERNPKKALYWIKQSADKNHLPAVEMMVFAYEKGKLGLAANPEQAKIWSLKSQALKAAQDKEMREKLEKYKVDKRTLQEAALKELFEKKAAAEKAEKEAVTKKVDAADVVNTDKKSEKISPAQAK